MAGGQEPIGVDVTNESTEVVPANNDRQWVAVINHSDTDMFCAVDQDAVLNKGLPLVPGGSLVLSKQGDMFSNGVINAIHGGSGTKRACAQEAT